MHFSPQFGLVLLLFSATFLFAEETPTAEVPPRGADPPVEGDDGSRWGFHPLLLLKESKVADAVELSQSQREQLDAVSQGFLNSLRPLLQNNQDGANEKQRAEFVARQTELLKDAAGKTFALLTQGQRKRFEQVAFQLRGADALYRADVGELLTLDEEQRASVVQIRADVIQAGRKLTARRREKQLDAKQFAAAVDKLNVEAHGKVRALLEDEQRTRLAELEGPPLGFTRSELKLIIGGKSQPASRD